MLQILKLNDSFQESSVKPPQVDFELSRYFYGGSFELNDINVKLKVIVSFSYGYKQKKLLASYK